jgi:hypothetical protein
MSGQVEFVSRSRGRPPRGFWICLAWVVFCAGALLFDIVWVALGHTSTLALANIPLQTVGLVWWSSLFRREWSRWKRTGEDDR